MTSPTRSARITHLERGIRRLETRLVIVRQQSNRLGWLRLLVFLAAAGLGLGLWPGNNLLAVSCAVIGFAIFALLVGRHNRVRAVIARGETWITIQQTKIARANLDWVQIPLPPAFTANDDHPFENDLDIGGARSLHQLLDTTATLQGSARLRKWLLTTSPDAKTITQRHKILDELPTTFCDRLTLEARLKAGKDKRLDTRLLSAWLAEPSSGGVSGQFVALLAGLCLLTAGLFVLWRTINIPPIWAISFLVYFGLSLSRITAVLPVLDEAFAIQGILNGLTGVFGYLEKYPFRDKPSLAQLCAPFQTAERPSNILRSLNVIVSAASLRNNFILWGVLNGLMPWDMFTAYRLSALRRKLAHLMPVWLEIWAELEALSALRLFAYLNPAYSRPQIQSDGMTFAAVNLGHPLIAHEQRVCNDFTMDTAKVTMLTGSNMSGKSSFLRTLGVNLVLANAGAVVTANSLNISLFRIYTCIKVSDSLAEGYSYFYAEVRRLKSLLDALDKPDALPLFFLIDEIFKGTNNRERLIGSEAYIQALLGKHGTGAISTHDLELASLTGLSNYHFADQVHDGQLTFDYKLQIGVSPTTNALRIMRLAGLPVGDD
ncbi:MAG: hypothetical protein GC179_09325 [Anaerolineaceae bacterium]|nr:hypothetical protein [Anaerolineaceae bacterium]